MIIIYFIKITYLCFLLNISILIFLKDKGSFNFSFWQDKNDPKHFFSRDSADKSVWHEILNGKSIFDFKLINESPSEVFIYDANRGYPAYVKLNDKSCLFSQEQNGGFFEIYHGFWMN